MKDKSEKNTAYYIGLPYTFVLQRDEEGDVIARIDELPGCIAHGSDDTEALARVKELQRVWIEDCLEAGDDIPEPVSEEDLPSGKWVQRVPRTLHRKLVRLAKKEQASLNQLVTSILSEAVGARSVAAFPIVQAGSIQDAGWQDGGSWCLEYTKGHPVDLKHALMTAHSFALRPIGKTLLISNAYTKEEIEDYAAHR
jgi:antitoxin HicB